MHGEDSASNGKRTVFGALGKKVPAEDLLAGNGSTASITDKREFQSTSKRRTQVAFALRGHLQPEIQKGPKFEGMRTAIA